MHHVRGRAKLTELSLRLQLANCLSLVTLFQRHRAQARQECGGGLQFPASTRPRLQPSQQSRPCKHTRRAHAARTPDVFPHQGRGRVTVAWASRHCVCARGAAGRTARTMCSPQVRPARRPLDTLVADPVATPGLGRIRLGPVPGFGAGASVASLLGQDLGRAPRFRSRIRAAQCSP